VRIFAATTGAQGEPESLAAVAYPNLLTSFHYNEGYSRSIIEIVGYDPKHWLFDSGAFTVWKQGSEIDVKAYIEWALVRIEELGNACSFINLDVIPGDAAKAKAPTKRQQQVAVEAGMRNADEMRAAGVPVMEVYHRFEPIEVFSELLDRRQPGEIIGIGGLVGRGHTNGKVTFCDTIWALLRDRYGWEGVPRVHALGVAPDTALGRR
jgi:hypothetical protein